MKSKTKPGAVIKVNKHIKPLPYNERTIPELVVGKEYFVCFGNNNARPSRLLEIRENGMVLMEKKKPLIFLLGKGYKFIIDANLLYPDEIGLTPIQAVHNTVEYQLQFLD